MTSSKKLTPDEVRKLTHNSPPTRYPWAIENSYAVILRKLITKWRAVSQLYIDQLIKGHVIGGNAFLSDARTPKKPKNSATPDLFELALNEMGNAIVNAESDQELTRICFKIVTATNNFSLTNIAMQTKAIGINPIAHNLELDNYVKSKIAENVTLIKSMRGDYKDKLITGIYNSVTKGGGATSLGDVVQHVGKVSNNRAALIANDQVGSVLGQLDAYRSKAAGANKYIWVSMRDDRVRPLHAALDQTIQYYDDPNGGDDGQVPGEPIRCRCVAVAVFD